MKLQSPAKINLFLHVTGRRPDGYHDLCSLMSCVGLYDDVTLNFDTPTIRVRCSHPAVPEDASNLAHRAAQQFFDALGASCGSTQTGVEIHITKKIPVAGGLGGGSSNAAAVLIGLNRYYNYPFSQAVLQQLGRGIGADVPFFIFRKPAIATGVGDVLLFVNNLPKFYTLLVNPDFHVSTAGVYKNLNLGLTNSQKKNKEPSFKARTLDPVRFLWNDLETVTVSKYPEIRTIKETLLANGADGALMTGSGPTVFGFFYDRKRAQEARQALSENATWRVYFAESIDGIATGEP